MSVPVGVAVFAQCPFNDVQSVDDACDSGCVVKEAEPGDEGPGLSPRDGLTAGDLGEEEADVVDCPRPVRVDVGDGRSPTSPDVCEAFGLVGRARSVGGENACRIACCLEVSGDNGLGLGVSHGGGEGREVAGRDEAIDEQAIWEWIGIEGPDRVGGAPIVL